MEKAPLIFNEKNMSDEAKYIEIIIIAHIPKIRS